MQEEIDGMDRYTREGFVDTFRHFYPDRKMHIHGGAIAPGQEKKMWAGESIISSLAGLLCRR